jgi:hypothetical protein
MSPRVAPVERGCPAPGLARPIRGVGLSLPAWASAGSDEGDAAFPAGCPMWSLVWEFPAVPWALMAQPPRGALVIPERAWRSPADLYAWDRAVGALAAQPRWLVVRGEEGSTTLGDTAREILTRYQRLVPRTNAASSGATFRRVLAAHQSLHDQSLPLVRADYDHALDVWQWVLRLAPNAGLELQLAALFHDIERLVSEPTRRIEHRAADYRAFKHAHAEAGAKLAADALDACGVERACIDAVARLIHDHERPSWSASSSEAAVLADADALSFFSLNSPGFADYYGAEHTRKKVRYTLGRMSSGAVRRLTSIRLRDDIRHELSEAARREAALGQGAA